MDMIIVHHVHQHNRCSSCSSCSSSAVVHQHNQGTTILNDVNSRFVAGGEVAWVARLEGERPVEIISSLDLSPGGGQHVFGFSPLIYIYIYR